MEPLIIDSARKHGVADEDMLHAYNNPMRYQDLDERIRAADRTRTLRAVVGGRVRRQHGRPGHRARDARPQKVPEVMTMPRSLQEILDHADEMSRRFADTAPDVRDAAPLAAIRDAVTDRAASERRLADAIAAARTAGASWAAIGGMLGTSGEAARKRYTGPLSKSA